MSDLSLNTFSFVVIFFFFQKTSLAWLDKVSDHVLKPISLRNYLLDSINQDRIYLTITD